MRRIWLHRGDISIGAGIGSMLLLVTWLAYLDGGTSGSLIHFYYIPIVAASYFLGDLGGIVASFAAALLAALLPLSDDSPQPLKDILIRGALFYFIALMTSRLFAKLREHRDDATSLLEVSRSVNASLRTAEVLRTITETAVRITAAKAASIRLLSLEQQELTPAASYGLSLDYLAKGPLRLADSPLDREVIAGRTVAILDARQDPRFRYQEEARAEGLISLLSLPLRRGREVFGVLRVYSGTPHHWSVRERRLLQAFADQAAVAIHNARLHESLQRSYWQTVNALTRAIEARDPQTLGHSERVTDYALQLGRALGLGPEDMESLRFAATLHDIGKIGLSEASLSAPGHLSMTQEVVHRMHPLIGLTILQPVKFLASTLQAVRYHHERWDGRGYPEGLAGEQIPLFARILGVANCYDTLRTSSPSREGLGAEQAAQALRRLAGTEVDPSLTDLFLRSLTKESAEHGSTRPGG